MRLAITPMAQELFAEQEVMPSLGDILAKHLTGDWGEIPAEDAAANRQALVNGERVMSVYTVTTSDNRSVKVWVITEADRSVTTVLFPEEY